jgi:hypothetical protein
MKQVNCAFKEQYNQQYLESAINRTTVYIQTSVSGQVGQLGVVESIGRVEIIGGYSTISGLVALRASAPRAPTLKVLIVEESVAAVRAIVTDQGKLEAGSLEKMSVHFM